MYQQQNPNMPPGQYPQQQPMYPQQQMQMQPQAYFPQQMSGWGILANVPGIYIKQKVELLEAVVGLEGKNSYKVYGTDVNGEKVGDALFKAKEESGCCMRICCPGPLRSYKMKLKEKEGKQVVAHGRRDYKCTFFCCNRPEILLYEGEEESKLLGKIIHKWGCCTAIMEVQDGTGQVMYYVEGSECQLGILCKDMPCKACQQAQFKVLNAQREQIAVMNKKSSGCCKACFTDVDYFSLIFPQNADPVQKALLLMATLLIDYSYFEENPANQSGGAGDLAF